VRRIRSKLFHVLTVIHGALGMDDVMAIGATIVART